MSGHTPWEEIKHKKYDYEEFKELVHQIYNLVVERIKALKEPKTLTFLQAVNYVPPDPKIYVDEIDELTWQLYEKFPIPEGKIVEVPPDFKISLYMDSKTPVLTICKLDGLMSSGTWLSKNIDINTVNKRHILI